MTPPGGAAAKGTLLTAALVFLAAQFLFILVDATGKYLVRDFPVLAVVWARYVFHFLFMAAYVVSRGDRALLRTTRPGLQVARALTVFSFAIFLFAALKYLPQAEATAISFVAPLIILVLAGPLLGERVGWARWAAAIAGFAGMLVIVRPGSGLATIGVVFAIATLACNAAFQLMSRRLAMTENPVTTVFLSALIGTVAATALLPFGLPDRWPDPWQSALFLSFGVTGSVSHLLLMRAYRLAPASFIAPLIYLHIVQATVAGLVFFGQFPDAVSLIGIAIILASGAGIALYEQRRSAADRKG
jgi:drug/metabolite transporter (DMT)-like permease